MAVVEKGKKQETQGSALSVCLRTQPSISPFFPKCREPKRTRPRDFLGLWLTVGKQTLIVCVCVGGEGGRCSKAKLLVLY